MVAFSRITEGQTLYDRHRYKTYGGSRMGEWIVKVLKVFPDTRSALCSWDNNPPRRLTERQLLRLKVSRASDAREEFPNIMMTRDEIIAMDNESLDSQVAQRIMGWTCCPQGWHPSQDIRVTFDLVEKLRRHFDISFHPGTHMGTYIAVFAVTPRGQEYAEAATPTRAITLAALLTVMRERGGLPSLSPQQKGRKDNE